MLSYEIAQFLSVTIWKLIFSDLLILPRFSLHPIICWWIFHCTFTIRLLNSCTWCTTELDSLHGYWYHRTVLLLLLLYITCWYCFSPVNGRIHLYLYHSVIVSYKISFVNKILHLCCYYFKRFHDMYLSLITKTFSFTLVNNNIKQKQEDDSC